METLHDPEPISDTHARRIRGSLPKNCNYTLLSPFHIAKVTRTPMTFTPTSTPSIAASYLSSFVVAIAAKVVDGFLKSVHLFFELAY